MAISSQMASALHIMAFIARAGTEGTRSAAVAKSLKTNPVVVRRLLKALEGQGLVELRRGRHGGVVLAREAAAISLGQIYKAVQREDGIFSLRGTVNRRCPVSRGMEALLPPLFDEARAAVEASLNRRSLADLTHDVE